MSRCPAQALTAPRRRGARHRARRATERAGCPPEVAQVPTGSLRRGHQSQQRGLGRAAEAGWCPWRGAETGGHVQPRAVAIERGLAGRRMPVQPADPGRIDPAVGHERAPQRQADLAAVGVPGEQQVVAVRDEPVHHPRLGRVHQAESQVGGRVGGSGDLLVTVPADVRVVHARDLDVEVAGLDAAAAVVEIQPPSRRSSRRQARPTAGQAPRGHDRPRWCATGSAPGSWARASTGRWIRRRIRPADRATDRGHPRKYLTAAACAIESPVFTTRSGSRASRVLIQDMSLRRPGVRWASEMCSTRTGRAPSGRTGTSWRRSRNMLRSMTET